MALDYHFTEPYLSKYIKRNTGKTFGELVRDVRLKKACYLLRTTNMRIGDISSHVGYPNLEHFVRVFRKEYNLTPSEYRNAGRE